MTRLARNSRSLAFGLSAKLWDGSAQRTVKRRPTPLRIPIIPVCPPILMPRTPLVPRSALRHPSLTRSATSSIHPEHIAPTPNKTH